MNMITEYIAAQIRETLQCSYCGKTEDTINLFNEHSESCESRQHFNEHQRNVIDDMTKKMVLSREAFNQWRAMRETVETAELSDNRECTCKKSLVPLDPCRASRVCVYKREAGPLIQKAKERFKDYVDAKKQTLEFRTSDAMRPLRVQRFQYILRQLEIERADLDIRDEVMLCGQIDTKLWPIEDVMRKSYEDMIKDEMDPEERSFETFMRVVDMLEAGDLEELGRSDEDELDPEGSYDEDFEEESMRFDKVAVWINNGLLKLDRLVLKRAMKSMNCIEICEKAIHHVDYKLLMEAQVLMQDLVIISMRILVRTMPIVFHLTELQNSNHFDEIYILGGTNGPDTMKRLLRLAVDSHYFSFEFRDKIRDKWMVRKKFLKNFKKKAWDNGDYRHFALKFQEILWNTLDVGANPYRKHKPRHLNAIIIANHYEELLAQACEPEDGNIPERFHKELEGLVEDGKVNWYRKVPVKQEPEKEDPNTLVLSTPSYQKLNLPSILLKELADFFQKKLEYQSRQNPDEPMTYIEAQKAVQAKRNAESKKSWANGSSLKNRDGNKATEKPFALYEELLEHACQQESFAQFYELSDEQLRFMIEQHEKHGHNSYSVLDLAALKKAKQQDVPEKISTLVPVQSENQIEQLVMQQGQSENQIEPLIMQQGLQVYHDDLLYDIIDCDDLGNLSDEEEEAEVGLGQEQDAEDNKESPEPIATLGNDESATHLHAEDDLETLNIQAISDDASSNDNHIDELEAGRIVRKRSFHKIEIEEHEENGSKRLKEAGDQNGDQNGHQESSNGFGGSHDDDSRPTNGNPTDRSASEDKLTRKSSLNKRKYPGGQVDADGFQIPALPPRIYKKAKRRSHKKAKRSEVPKETHLTENQFFVEDGHYVVKGEDGTLLRLGPTNTLYNPALDEDLFPPTDPRNNIVHEVENARTRFRRDHDIADFSIEGNENMLGTFDSFLELSITTSETVKEVFDEYDMQFLSILNE